MKPTAFVLVILGLVALVFGVIDYSNSRTTVELGGMTASITENGARSIAAIIAGGIALVVGIALYSSERRRA